MSEPTYTPGENVTARIQLKAGRDSWVQIEGPVLSATEQAVTFAITVDRELLAQWEVSRWRNGIES